MWDQVIPPGIHEMLKSAILGGDEDVLDASPGAANVSPAARARINKMAGLLRDADMPQDHKLAVLHSPKFNHVVEAVLALLDRKAALNHDRFAESIKSLKCDPLHTEAQYVDIVALLSYMMDSTTCVVLLVREYEDMASTTMMDSTTWLVQLQPYASMKTDEDMASTISIGG